MLIQELLDTLEKGGEAPDVLVLRGEDAYLTRELKRSLKKQSWDLVELEFKRGGPDARCEDQVAELSLFQSRRVTWCEASSLPSQWNELGATYWKRALAQVQPGASILILRADADKRVQWKKWGAQEVVDLQVETREHDFWLKRMNTLRGNFLDAARLRFLAHLDADLMMLDNWVEIWKSGGDLWAAQSLGWNASGISGKIDEGNVVYAWVDDVLERRSQGAQEKFSRLMKEGAEPFQLLALLAKSVRIWAELQAGRQPMGQPDFLIRKLSRLKPRRGSPAEVSRFLLKKTAEIDRLLKSSPVKPFQAFQRLFGE